VLRSIAPLLNRWLAALCLALLVTHAGAVTAKGVDQLQHSALAAGDHDHWLFSEILPDLDHHHDDDAGHYGDAHADHDDDHHPAGDRPDAGSQHHHGDPAPGLIVMFADGMALPLPDSRSHPIRSDRTNPFSDPSGPERPPRDLIVNA